ncbi:MAG: hypothetical protein ACI4BD_04460 [Paludibacteraceae bacterium]
MNNPRLSRRRLYPKSSNERGRGDGIMCGQRRDATSKKNSANYLRISGKSSTFAEGLGGANDILWAVSNERWSITVVKILMIRYCLANILPIQLLFLFIASFGILIYVVWQREKSAEDAEKYPAGTKEARKKRGRILLITTISLVLLWVLPQFIIDVTTYVLYPQERESFTFHRTGILPLSVIVYGLLSVIYNIVQSFAKERAAEAFIATLAILVILLVGGYYIHRSIREKQKSAHPCSEQPIPQAIPSKQRTALFGT